ncbi:MAG: hypothetical protein L3J74_11715, partial [Bacteroidales bacterium]|nr:hypothetical protein [Bacteroidales bacterium]
MQPFENIDLKHVNSLIAKYRVLNRNWEHMQIGNELYPEENKLFLMNLVHENLVKLMENEIIKYLQVFDKEKLSLILNELIFELKRNIEIYEKRENEINETHKDIAIRYNWYNQIYLESKRILMIIENYTNNNEYNLSKFNNIEWKKQKIDLSELIYVLYKSESIYKNG